jgi:sugar lactone lactonase YvrE
LAFWLIIAAFTGVVQSQPVITSSPTNQIVLIAGDAFFKVDVTGPGPFRYQWRFNGTNLPSDFITTLAGNGTADYGGDGVSASRTSLNSPFGVTVDSQGNVYIADFANNRVRKVDSNGIISTVAGDGAAVYAGDGAAATNASLFNPAGVALDGSGNLYIADYSNHRVRKVDTNGIITTVAGNGTGTYAGDGSPATNASLQNPFGLAVDAGGNLYIADSGNDRIRRVDVNGIISTVAGGGLIDFGPGTMATNAGLVYPTGVAVDPTGNLFIADNNDNRVCKVDTTGLITTYGGTGGNVYSGDGGPAVDAGISYPRGLATDALGNLFIAVFYDNRIRMIDTNGIITTLVGNGDSTYNGDNISATNASLFYPQGVALDGSGAIYIADFQNNRVRMVATPGPVLKLTNITTNNDGFYDVIVSNDSGSVTSSVVRLEVALPPGIVTQPQSQQILLGTSVAFSVQPSGTPPFSYQWQFNGTNISNATAAQYTIPAVSTNDAGSYAVLVTSPYGSITSAVAALTVLLPPFISVQPVDQSVVLGGSTTFSVSVTGPGPYWYQWRLNGTNLPTDIITTFAGRTNSGFSGDFGPATNASLRSPVGVAFDAAGNLFIADTYNNRIRKVDTNGVITTVAGKGTSGPPGDGGAATNASIVAPNGVAVDSAGNVFIAETGNSHIRKVRTDGIIVSVAGTAFFGFSGDGGAATNAALHNPQGLAIDSFGNLLIADTGNNRIREIRPDGIIMTVAGKGGPIGSPGDGGAATNATLNGPTGICVDSAGNWFIADMNYSLVRKVDTNGVISTVAGKSTFSFSGDGGPATNASMNHPIGVAVDSRGNLFIADSGNNRVREVTRDGVINTVAGQATSGFSGDGGPATLASLNYPTAVAIACSDHVFIADSSNSRIRTVTVAGPELTLDHVTLAIAGAYDVVVANANGSATSHVATLTVTVPSLPPLAISLIANNQAQLQLNTTPSDSLILQSTTNLAPQIFWENLVTNLADTSGSWTFTSPVTRPAVFYRVKRDH